LRASDIVAPDLLHAVIAYLDDGNARRRSAVSQR